MDQSTCPHLSPLPPLATRSPWTCPLCGILLDIPALLTAWALRLTSLTATVDLLEDQLAILSHRLATLEPQVQPLVIPASQPAPTHNDGR
jgi:hypothetical protein